MDAGSTGQWASAAVAILAFVTSIWAARSKRYEDSIASVRAEAQAAATAANLALAQAMANAAGERARAFERIDGCEVRIARAESELAHLPNKDLVHSLQVGMARLEGQVGALVERISPISRALERVEQSLMERNDR